LPTRAKDEITEVRGLRAIIADRRNAPPCNEMHPRATEWHALEQYASRPSRTTPRNVWIGEELAARIQSQGMESSNRWCQTCGRLGCVCAVALLSFAGPHVERIAVGACADQSATTACAPPVPLLPHSDDGEIEQATAVPAIATLAPPASEPLPPGQQLNDIPVYRRAAVQVDVAPRNSLLLDSLAPSADHMHEKELTDRISGVVETMIIG
jgi:hypothetical protein